MDGNQKLLERFTPTVLYDSLEAFFVDCPAELTDNPGNRLLDAKGQSIAAASAGLGLHSLGPGDARQAERLSIHGSDYRSQYVRLITSRPDLRDWVFGRVHPLGEDTKWLQYWFFYFYDDPALAAQIGAHEGDWEMIQLRVQRIGDDEWEPDVAVYAQHKYASQRRWEHVKRDPPDSDTPVVYSARGSHASYFEPGLYDTEWFDVADGKGPRRKLELMVLDDEAKSPGWAYWPGRWGDTEPGQGMLLTRLLAKISRVKKALGGIQAWSPEAPCTHPSWKDPQRFFESATEREALDPVARQPLVPVTFERRGSRLHYKYRTPPEWQDAPSTLVLTVAGDPPRSFTVDVRGKSSGGGTVPWLKLAPGQAYEVMTSFRDTFGRSSIPFPTTVDKQPGSWHLRPAGAIGYLLALACQPIWQLRARLRKLKRASAG